MCTALQILNHIQDCKDDYKKIDRVYLPKTFLKKYNVELEQLNKSYIHKNLRLAINDILKQTQELLNKAERHKKVMKALFFRQK